MKDISTIPESELIQIKTKLRNLCEKYYNVKVSNHQGNVINNRMKRSNTFIMKQDKGRGLVSMDKSKYIEKSLTILSTKQFQKLNLNPTKSTEEKFQRMVRQIKSKLTIQEFKRLYPSGSAPGKFYDTVNLHKLDSKGLFDDLPIRPIISNVNTSTYHLSKYLAVIGNPKREPI